MLNQSTYVWRDGSSADVMDRPIGSEPYRVAEVDAPRRLVLDRVPDYWRADLGVNRGRWNFDRAFRHAVVMLPLWRNGTTRLAWWNRFERPAAELAGFPSSPLDR